MSDITLINGDCMEYMAGCEDNAFELALVDPPYFKAYGKGAFTGTKVSSTGVTRTQFNCKHFDVPSEKYFCELVRVSRNQIVWGCNYYAKFIPTDGRIVWDKKNDSSSYSKAEIASHSFGRRVDMFRFEWNGMLQEDMKNKEQRIHSCQKPVALYKWLLTNYAKEGDRILDTHGGSMSSVIACIDKQHDMTCLELDADYFETAVKRIDKHLDQLDMFIPRPRLTIERTQ